ncbi:hypothetical protein Agub_g4785 [Astrephomene gubernaculifera]|uniref:F-box domain-containing protein n=1 Tax=Astrephomene gubernaculifera TaxID=47775 RepID=A0AAD3DNF9_9CHLO|nr:hypothetical protein Agub_g4785 [Astrephomene gubernaculifera]
MFEDLQTAMTQAERMGRLGRTLDQLVAAALRVLPKQKRTLVATAQKRAQVQLRRSIRRGGEVSGSEEEDGEAAVGPLPSLHDLPTEVVESIFEHLGPVELARCACVSRCWRDLSRGADGAWCALLDLTFPGRPHQAASQPAGPAGRAYRQFRLPAAGRPRALLRWSGRVLAAGGPAWLSSDALRRMAPAALAGLRFPREDQVVRWACHEPLARSSSSGSSSYDDSSSDDEAVTVGASRLRLWAVPR